MFANKFKVNLSYDNLSLLRSLNYPENTEQDELDKRFKKGSYTLSSPHIKMVWECVSEFWHIYFFTKYPVFAKVTSLKLLRCLRL